MAIASECFPFGECDLHDGSRAAALGGAHLVAGLEAAARVVSEVEDVERHALLLSSGCGALQGEQRPEHRLQQMRKALPYVQCVTVRRSHLQGGYRFRHGGGGVLVERRKADVTDGHAFPGVNARILHGASSEGAANWEKDGAIEGKV